MGICYVAFMLLTIDNILVITHKYTMSTKLFRTVCYMSKSTLNINMKGLNDAVSMLKIDLCLPGVHLRLLLLNCATSNTYISTQYVANVCRRYALYRTNNPHANTLNIQSGIQLSSSCRIVKTELGILQLPDIRFNYRLMYQNLIQSGPKT